MQRVLVAGEFACFTRPELSVERYSYDAPTPCACVGVLEAIYRKPQMRWHVTRIHILNPIRRESLRRKELAEHIQAALEELDRIDREILEFRYLDRMTYAEIAEMLEISRDAAMQRHARALRRIKLDDPRFEE